MPIQLDQTDPSQPEIVALLEQHLDLMREVSPPGTVHALDLEGLMAPSVTFWSAREKGVLLGCGALKELSPQEAEIKSMHTQAAARGKGIGALLVEEILREARARGYARLCLETGSTQAFAPARRLYARHGFQDCGPFGDYVEHPHSAFMELVLERS